MLFLKPLIYLYNNINRNKFFLVTSILLFWGISIFNTISFIQGQNKSFDILNMFLSFKSEGFVSFAYLPFCFIATAILLHEQDDPFLLIRFTDIYYYSKFKAIQLFILSIMCTLIEIIVFFANSSILKIYANNSFNIDTYSSFIFIFYYTSVLLVTTFNLLLLQTIFNTIFQNRLISFICMILLILIDQFLNSKLGISIVLYHGMIIQELNNITLNILINQSTYCLGALCILLVGFYHTYSNKEFY